MIYDLPFILPRTNMVAATTNTVTWLFCRKNQWQNSDLFTRTQQIVKSHQTW